MTEEKITCALPPLVDLRYLAGQDLSYTLKLDASLLPRLSEACVKVQGPALAKVRFYRDLNGLNTIAGTIEVKAVMVCQRCLNEYELNLQAKFKSTCDEEKARSLNIDDKCDFVDLNAEGELALYDYLEDCLLLELPSVPRHPEDADCAVKGSSWSAGELTQEANPFAVLSGLKDQLRQK